MSLQLQQKWHELDVVEAARLLEVDIAQGLDAAEVKRRHEQYGANKLSGSKRTPAWKRFLLQFAQPLMYILLLAVVVTTVLGEYVDAAVIFAVVVMNAIIGYLQETKAEKAIEALLELVVTEATVLREGKKQRINSVELVPGDIVHLQSGDKVPADMRLFHVKDLQVDESALTGESLPVQKDVDPIQGDTGLADRKNLVFAGTLVTYSQAEGMVWGTGNHTQTGLIAKMIDEAADLSTPLTRKLAEFSRLILWAILVLAVLTFAIGLIRGQSAVEIFMATVALAVSAIPEGLPAAVTITLAIGVSRMAKRRAIIRKLSAVEALGGTTVICSDKTGTLTQNEMTVQQIFTGGNYYELSGSGYDPEGELSFEDRAAIVHEHLALKETLLAGLLCNDSKVVRDDGRLKVEGDPTEAAMIVAAQKSGLAPEKMHEAHPRVDSIPFESSYQYMATLHDQADLAGGIIYKKGAVERVLERCTNMLNSNGEIVHLDQDAIRRATDAMASRGLRVLALARLTALEGQRKLDHDHVKEGLTFLGLQGMMDPPRDEAITSVKKCQEAGIQVKMITGDHVLTAKSIASQLGLKGGANGELIALSGRELEGLDEKEFSEASENASVFGRVAPEQKLELVKALQTRGHVVAMTGDGVNDAPALKQADIGVAMGIAGTDVSKGAADMLLTDDNFASIEAAVEEGRRVFDNLTKFIICTLPTNAGESIILLAAITAGTALPILPVQLLWINLITSVLLGLMLVFEPQEPNLMQRAPRDPKAPILTFPFIMRMGLVATLMLIGAFAAFQWEQHMRGKSLIEARTTVVNVIVMVEIFYLLNCRSLLHSMFSVGFFSNPMIFAGIGFTLLAQVLFTHTSLMNRLFHTAPLDGGSWLYVVGVGFAVYLIVEFEKWLRVKSGEEMIAAESN